MHLLDRNTKDLPQTRYNLRNIGEEDLERREVIRVNGDRFRLAGAGRRVRETSGRCMSKEGGVEWWREIGGHGGMSRLELWLSQVGG